MKIGVIAMSGIRVCDRELLRLGLTLPGFVERSKMIASLPSLGLLILAGMSSGHQVSYLEVSDISELRTLPDFNLVAIFQPERADQASLRAGGTLSRTGRAGRYGRTARQLASAGSSPVRQRRCRGRS